MDRPRRGPTVPSAALLLLVACTPGVQREWTHAQPHRSFSHDSAACNSLVAETLTRGYVSVPTTLAGEREFEAMRNRKLHVCLTDRGWMRAALPQW
jgi:hypothetical protein